MKKNSRLCEIRLLLDKGVCPLATIVGFPLIFHLAPGISYLRTIQHSELSWSTCYVRRIDMKSECFSQLRPP
jgi:hypothetical protein